MNLYFSVNSESLNFLKGYLILYWLLTSAGLSIAGLCGYYQWRYKFSYRNWFGILVGIFFILVAYQISWTHFYVLSVKNQKIYLQYFFPKRTKTFSIREIKSFSRRSFGKNNLYYFLIETRNGKAYSSAAMNIQKLDLNEERLKKYLAIQLGYSKAKQK